MRIVPLLALFIVASLAVPVVHASPQAANVDYTPRIGKSLTYSIFLSSLEENNSIVYNYTLTGMLTYTINSYQENFDEADANVSYNGTVSLYLNGTLQITQQVSDTFHSDEPTWLGVVHEDILLILAINVTHIPEMLYTLTFELGPSNFTASLDTTNDTLTIDIYLHGQAEFLDMEYGHISITYLLRYGIVSEEKIYYVASEDRGAIMYYAHYKLVKHDEIEEIPTILQIPQERNGMKAAWEIYNKSSTGSLEVTFNEFVVIGEVILAETAVTIQSETITISRTSVFGRYTQPDDPRAVPPVLVYPTYLDAYATLYGANETTYTLDGQTYTVYVFQEKDGEAAFIKDLGILAYAHDANNTAGIKLTSLELGGTQESAGEESSGGGIGSLSTAQMAVIILAIVALVLALLAVMLRKG